MIQVNFKPNYQSATAGGFPYVHHRTTKRQKVTHIFFYPVQCQIGTNSPHTDSDDNLNIELLRAQTAPHNAKIDSIGSA